jgi:hypothetical protein
MTKGYGVGYHSSRQFLAAWVFLKTKIPNEHTNKPTKSKIDLLTELAR